MSRLRASLPLVGILIAGVVLRVWGLEFGLPHPLARPDEEFTLRIARGFFHGDLNPHFFQWPSLSFYAMYGILRAGYGLGALAGWYPDLAAFEQSVAGSPAWIYLTTRGISVVCGLLTIVTLYRIAQSLTDRLTATLAAAFLAVAFLHVRDSHFGVLEAPLTLAMTAATAWLVWAWRDDRPWAAFALAGLWTGLAASLKYNGAVMLVPAAIVGIIRLPDAAPKDRVSIAVGVAAYVATATVVFVAGTPYALLDPAAFRDGLAQQAIHFSAGHGGISVTDAWRYHFMFSLRGGVGWPLLAAALAGVVISCAVRWRAALVLWSAPAVLFALAGAGETAFVRYMTPLVPSLCLAAAWAIGWTATRFGWPRAATILVAAAVAAPTAFTAVQFDRILTRPDTRVQAAAWLARTMSPGATIYESGSEYAHPDLAWPAETRAAFHLVEYDDRAQAFTVAGGKADWVVVAESPLRLYVPQPVSLTLVLGRDYELAATFRAADGLEREAWFDRQDAFFMPYLNLSERRSLGPDLFIYRRK